MFLSFFPGPEGNEPQPLPGPKAGTAGSPGELLDVLFAAASSTREAQVKRWKSRKKNVSRIFHFITHRIHGAAIYGNMDPINTPPILAYIPYMDPMG